MPLKPAGLAHALLFSARMDLKSFYKRRSVQVAFMLFNLCFLTYCIYGFVDLAYQSHTRTIKKEFAAAAVELEKSPPGVHRGEVFLQRLKAIDPGYAPSELKQALKDYISAFEQGLDALKAGQDTRHYDAALAAAKQALLASVEKYD